MRDPTAGAGLVIVQGRQHTFGLESVWKSDALPRPGVVVDVEFDDAGRVTAMMAVSEARLAREQAEAAIALATAKGAGVVARLALPRLVALGALAVGWFGLATIDIDGSFPGQAQFTFWRALGALGAGQPLEALRSGSAPSAGIWGLSALVCLAAPLLMLAWNDRRAYLAGLLPLAFMLAVAVPLLDLARKISAAGPELVSLGAGAYVSVLTAVYVALTGIKRFLVAAAREATVLYENEQSGVAPAGNPSGLKTTNKPGGAP
jgi:hypothetical protein